MEEEEEMKDTPKKQRRKRKLRQDPSPELPSPAERWAEKIRASISSNFVRILIVLLGYKVSLS